MRSGGSTEIVFITVVSIVSAHVQESGLRHGTVHGIVGANVRPCCLLYTSSGYEDADEKCKECDYRLAQQYQTLEQYDNAIPLFEALGDYQDCRTRLADCYYQQGLQLSLIHI